MARKNQVAYVEGAEELSRALQSVGDRVTGLLLQQAAEKGAEIIAEEARLLAPKDTGKLAESIHVEAGRLQQGRAVMNVSYGKDAWYGELVELGTEKMAAQPFLRPALDAKAEEAKDAVTDALRELLKDVLS